MNQAEQIFPQLICNADDADHILLPGQVLNSENVRFGSTDKGMVGVVESIGSTRQLSEALPSVTFMYLGGAEDIENNRFVYFLYNVHGPWHKIMCYSQTDDTVYTVLTSAQVTGGLNFSKDKFIHSARVVNGLLYWTDDLNEPRRLNIDAGIKLNHPSYNTDVAAYSSPVAESVITVIRKQPNYPPTFEKSVQTVPEPLVANFIGDSAFKFTYRYFYRDNEIGTFSGLSKLAPYNDADESWDRIDVTIPLSEYIEQDVQRVELAAQYVSVDGELSGAVSIIKTWDKANADDLAAIEAHNAGTTALSYGFLNDQIGISVGATEATKPFDSVPIRSKALEIARNRLFLGNNLEGYDTPTVTSLGDTPLVFNEASGDGGAVTGQWFSLTYTRIDTGGSGQKYLIDITGIGAQSGYYEPLLTPPPFPATIDFSTLNYVGAGIADILAYYFLTFPELDGFSSTGDESEITDPPSDVSLIGQGLFKTASPYQVGVVFFDKYGRKSGVVTNDNCKATTPDREYGSIAYFTGLQWTLSNANAVQEIPEWADYYCVVMTKCLRTRFFLDLKADNMTYVDKDADGEYTFATSAFANDLIGVGINVKSLASNNLGYQYAAGDIIKLYAESGQIYNLTINDQSGDWLIAELLNLSTLDSSSKFLYEIYTPYRQSENEPFYEQGEMYPIVNAGTSNRQYGVLTDTIDGDVFLVSRQKEGEPDEYLVEAMSPNDKFYATWLTNAGRINLYDNIGQQWKKTSISWSNIYVPGTRTNGLSSFDALDEKAVPEECAQIQKLLITSKVQGDQGIVMLAICEKETVSLYLGEAQLVAQTGNAFIASSPEIIGTMNVLKGSFGTVNPESVTAYRGLVFWLDLNNGKYIQYSANGLFPVSNYKLTRFWKLFSDLFKSMSAEAIEALGGRPFVFSTVDPHHQEFLISIPKLSNTPPKGYLPDYPETIYPFDLWDAQGKTMVYRLDVEPNHWQGAYSFNPEGFITLNNKLYSFKNGHLYEHNQTTSYNEFYGVQYKSRIMLVSNSLPTVPKVYNNISLELFNALRPSLVYFRSEEPYEQASDLVDFDWKNLEGVLYSTIYRNKLTPTATGLNTGTLMSGEKIRTNVLKILLEWSVTTTPLQLRTITLGYEVSRGHKTLIK